MLRIIEWLRNRWSRRLSLARRAQRARLVRPGPGRLAVELLEDRLAPAVITVTTTTDNGDNVTPTAGSLRAAIIASNASVGVQDKITFAIGSGVQLMAPPRPLPEVTDSVIIDG